MRSADLFQETYTALHANRARSGLTILGIVIGISSVIAMISIGNGAQASISASIQSIGSNLIIVMPGAQRGPGAQISTGRGNAQSLTNADAEAIQTNISEILAVAADVQTRKQITARGTNTNTNVIATTPAYTIVRNVEIDEGTFITDSHVRSLSKVAVLGPTTRDDLFGEGASALGQSIRVGGVQFTVIGITKTKGGSGFHNSDDVVYIPLTTGQKFLVGNDYLSNISVSAASSDTATQVQNDITALLLERHHITDASQADFSTMNQADIVATASSVTGTFTVLLGAVAGISLVVGGIGIMNMMLTTVTERTKEIGLRKAIGARRSDISMQFLAEAVALTGIGGVVGIALGWSICYGLTYFGILQTSVSTLSVVLAFGVSAIIGIVFGYYPARRASLLNPIDALRYE